MKRATIMIALVAAAPAGAQTQAQMTVSAQREWTSSDDAMTGEWRRTFAFMKALDARDKSRGGGFGYAAAALASQRAWLSFRDRHCVLEGGQFAGGTAQSMAQYHCLARLSRERSTQLKNLRWSR